MIIGIGSDLIDIRRIEQVMERYGERFLNRIFTEAEREKCDGRGERAASYAKRFAAKEACAKALGTGFSQGIFWRDLSVTNLASGAPTMLITGVAAQHLQNLMPDNHEPQIHLSLTDDFPLAQAFVVISAVAKPLPPR